MGSFRQTGEFMADTIAAIATPLGEGGVGIVRVSGPNSLSIMKSIYRECPDEVIPRHVYYGHAVDNQGIVIDDMVAIYMKAPHTFTGDDVVEFQAHGSNVSLRLILRSAISAGARIADPGEFTKNAFLNGRLDLSQAEAVIDLIKAKSEKPLSIASDQLNGSLGQEIASIRNNIKDVLAQMAVNIDFPDEDIEQVSYDEFVAELSKQQVRLDKLIKSSEFGKLAREGIKLALVGRTNVGKSSLMNGLLGDDRAIVTNIPGTTRDTIEESATIGGYPIVIVDTAGIRDTDDVIEQIGIERSKNEITIADLVIMVIDGSGSLEDEDFEIAQHIERKQVLLVVNKEDLGVAISESEIEKIQSILNCIGVVYTTVKTIEGIGKVREAIEHIFTEGIVKSDGGNIVTNERHKVALVRASESLAHGIELLDMNEPLEIAEIEAHDAFQVLGEIIGETASEEILDTVFSKFCLGK
ncbi:tRNA uridine(34) 5-carboxymethylaminomethyl synthesis GTPase MnmE [Mogibacterium pumilum]|uniref:tRNA modification GTPase MnmE n=2 Tax=Mogibacterium pumilum TaxID=86332 RepID=A0A223AQN4_9FIRM|nr:tRNA uridine(34) 5-carboxymethylaminomethyl synthesis GTPase MnmE [Mogibacterium pumilum]